MGMKTGIEWTDATWNPVTGCDKISQGCKNCYAHDLALRLKSMGQHGYRNGFDLTLQPDMLEKPLQWKKPRMIFVNSMSDLFHDGIPLEYIQKVFEVMRRCPQHTFQVLTKRSERLLQLSPDIDWPPNVWQGVSIELQRYSSRLEDLKRTSAKIKFLSLEPLLGSLDLNLNGIDWVIVGGESGPKSRPIQEEWVLSLRDQCSKYQVPFFFKQWGGINKKAAGNSLHGLQYTEFPKPTPIFALSA